jgi:uncharacterized protein (TIGR02996 family)
MISDRVFFRMIQSQPEDDGPRLVCADWLEERGEMRRAELIRLQCSGSHPERAQRLIREYGSTWAGPALRHAYSYAFRRGFVEEIAISAEALLRHGDEILESAPVRLVRVIGARPLLDRIVAWPNLARIDALHLTGCHLGDEGARLLSRSPYLGGLRTLRLGQNAIADSGVEALADSIHLSNLRTLALHGNLIGDAGAMALATAKQLHGLTSLDLSDNLIGDAGAEALARTRGFRHLERLELANQFKGWSAGLALRGRPYTIQQEQRQALIARFGELVCVF